MEAVVKAMDPNSSYRETVIDAATEILGEVVKLYVVLMTLRVPPNNSPVILPSTSTRDRKNLSWGQTKGLLYYTISKPRPGCTSWKVTKKDWRRVASPPTAVVWSLYL